MTIAIQDTFEELGLPLAEVTFVVVDLETTGTGPADAEITEIGAVKVKGGQVLGEFQTLVRTRNAIPPMITALTGITTAMVYQAPELPGVMHSFMEFARGAVLVAHNAPFDISFLKAACAQCDITWPAPMVVDTVKLARRVVTRDEAPNHKLSTLARVFGASTSPEHRALADARATVDVLHALLGRLGNLGVTHYADLPHAADDVPPARRRKRHLADHLPTTPGVYQFVDERGTVLYVGTATNLRSRVRSYFTTAERRGRMNEMVGIATEVIPIECATVIEAQVREVRLIAQLKPPYNRRDRFPARLPWVRLSTDPVPILATSRAPKADGAAYLGPFASKAAAEMAIKALREGLGWYEQLSTTSEATAHAQAAWTAITRDISPVVTALEAKMAGLAQAQRYEEAAACRDRLVSLLRGLRRTQRVGALAQIASMTAALHTQRGWEVAEVRHAKLAGTALVPPGADLHAAIAAVRATAEVVPPPVTPMPASSASEARLVADWLEQPGVHIMFAQQPWCEPLDGAGRFARYLDAAKSDLPL